MNRIFGSLHRRLYSRFPGGRVRREMGLHARYLVESGVASKFEKRVDVIADTEWKLYGHLL